MLKSNSILIAFFILIVLAAGGYYFYSQKEAPEPTEEITTGKTKEITVTVAKGTWRYDPDEFEVNRGDRVKITIVNGDDVDHGFAIDEFGVNERIPTGGQVTTEFVASRVGDFTFYCSVPCGEGEVDGHTRGHFDQTGTLHVIG